MEFIVGPPKGQSGKGADTLEVRYECACGCQPKAQYRRGTREAGHEHCCCGNVHFVGFEAVQRLRAYVAEHQARGQDPELKYSFHEAHVKAPWGEAITVAYALPDKPKPH